MNFDPASLQDCRIKQAYDYWESLRHGREMPAQLDIELNRSGKPGAVQFTAVTR